MIDTLPHTLGAFTLTSVIRETPDTVTYSAVQTLVDREAEVVVLRPEAVAKGMTAEFVSDARAKVAVHYEAMSEVFEASEEDGCWYVAQEKLEGRPLSLLVAKYKRLSVSQMLKLLRVLADASFYFESNGISTDLPRLDMIYMTKDDSFTFVNPVRHGARRENEARELMETMGAELEVLRPISEPGQTRLATLFTWMREGCEGEALTWSFIRETVEEIEAQITPDKGAAGATLRLLPEATAHLREGLKTPAARRTGRIVAFLVVLLAGASALTWLLMPSKSSPKATENRAIHAPVKLVLNSGEPVWLSPRLVTVGEYNRFLKALPTLSEIRLQAIHEGLPDHVDFRPKDWELMYEMASKGRMWKGRDITLDSPVTNVDYWSALACARYFRGRLPGKEELDRIGRSEASSNFEAKGGYREWSSTFERRGAMYDPAYLIWKSPGEWDYESDPVRREADLGFRIAYDRQPSI